MSKPDIFKKMSRLKRNGADNNTIRLLQKDNINPFLKRLLNIYKAGFYWDILPGIDSDKIIAHLTSNGERVILPFDQNGELLEEEEVERLRVYLDVNNLNAEHRNGRKLIIIWNLYHIDQEEVFNVIRRHLETGYWGGGIPIGRSI